MLFIRHSEVLGGRGAVVEIEGPVNSLTFLNFQDYADSLIKKGVLYILLDSFRVEYLSSEGIGALLFVHKKVSAAHGRFIIFSVPGEIASLFRVLGFDKIITVAEGMPEALEIAEKHKELNSNEEGQVIRIDDGRVRLFDEGGADVPYSVIRRNELSQARDKTDDAGVKTPSFIPFVMECVKCSSLVRVRKSGDYRCPGCNAVFSVSGDMSVKYK